MATSILAFEAEQNSFALEKFINVDRFWSLVNVGPVDQCWEWRGAKDSLGYGRFHVSRSRNSTILTHRAAFGIATGEDPEAVCHRCDNPSCCNPRHLFGGTRADNNRDMAEKGRNRVPRLALRGEKHHQAKLSNDDALEIKRIYAAGGVTQRQIAKRYGVCQRSISKVVRGISFKNEEKNKTHPKAS